MVIFDDNEFNFFWLWYRSCYDRMDLRNDFFLCYVSVKKWWRFIVMEEVTIAIDSLRICLNEGISFFCGICTAMAFVIASSKKL